MTDDTENLILEHLRMFRNDLAGMRSEMHAEFRDLKVRMTGVEQGLVTLNGRMDRMEDRLARIEKRLDLTEA